MCDADVLPRELQNHLLQCRHWGELATDYSTHLDHTLRVVDTTVAGVSGDNMCTHLQACSMPYPSGGSSSRNSSMSSSP
jgi:hypothetical protein